jgi:hypothetical protein
LFASDFGLQDINRIDDARAKPLSMIFEENKNKLVSESIEKSEKSIWL